MEGFWTCSKCFGQTLCNIDPPGTVSSVEVGVKEASSNTHIIDLRTEHEALEAHCKGHDIVRRVTHISSPLVTDRHSASSPLLKASASDGTTEQ